MEAGNIDIMSVMWEAGFVVKFVLLLLLLSSVVSWAIIIKKQRMLKRVQMHSDAFLDVYLSAGSLTEIVEKTGSMEFSPYRQMFIHGNKELQKIRKTFSEDPNAGVRSHFKQFGFGVIERSLKKGVNESNIKLERFLSILASIGSVTPFIGLFGTVWGIIDSFTGIAGGGATLDAVAPGIAEALVATAVGLFAAIPAVWFYNHYSNVIGVINSQMETFGQEFINIVERSIIDKE